MLQVDTIIGLIKTVPFGVATPVRVVWVTLEDGERESVRAQIEALRGNEPIVPIVLRQPMFRDPNMVLGDFYDLIERNKAAFAGVVCGPEGSVTVLILARSALGIPQVSSPVCLPTWFPVAAGREVHFRIADFATEAQVGFLDCREARVEEISSLFFELESLLLGRIRSTAARDPTRVRYLLDVLNEGATISVDAFWSECEEALARVTDRRAYRPSIRGGSSLSSKLLRAVVKTSMDRLPRLAEALARAVDCDDSGAKRPTLMAVVLRPVQRLPPGQQACHSILSEMYAAYQLTTAAAHAGEYPAFSPSLVFAMSHDLRSGLRESLQFLRSGERAAELGTDGG